MRVIGDKYQISEDVYEFMISYLPFPKKSIHSKLAKLFFPQYMNKFERGLQGDAAYQVSSSTPSSFRQKAFLKFVFFVLIFQLATPGSGPALIPGASYELTW